MQRPSHAQPPVQSIVPPELIPPELELPELEPVVEAASSVDPSAFACPVIESPVELDDVVAAVASPLDVPPSGASGSEQPAAKRTNTHNCSTRVPIRGLLSRNQRTVTAHG
jgi:hypothetical protein